VRYCVTRRAVTPLGAWGHRFLIADEPGTLRYRVGDRYRPLAATATFRDAAGPPLLQLEFRHLLLGCGYFILREAEDEIAGSIQVQRDLTVEGPELTIRAPDELDLVGSLAQHEYYVMRRGWMVIYVSHRWCARQRHTYGVDVVEGEDEPLLLAVVLALDMLFLYE
jgi:uncharacterized protein YxjI